MMWYTVNLKMSSYMLFCFSHMACEEGRAEIAVTLVENGANIYIQNKVRPSVTSKS